MLKLDSTVDMLKIDNFFAIPKDFYKNSELENSNSTLTDERVKIREIPKLSNYRRKFENISDF